MPIPNNHSFSSAFPFEIKIENQFMNEGHSTLYIVNKVDAAATEQKVKLLINAVAFGNHTLKGYGKDQKPGPKQYNLALAFRSGTMLKGVVKAFSKTLKTAFNEALKEKNNTCRVEGPDIQPDQSQVWYMCFEKDVEPPKEQDLSLSVSPFPVKDESISFKHIFGGTDGKYYGLDENGQIHWYDPKKKKQWTKYDNWHNGGGYAKSMVCMPDGQFYYIGGGDQLNRPITAANTESWRPYDLKAVSIARYGTQHMVAVGQSHHLIQINLDQDNPATELLSEKLKLIGACALPSGQILGVDTNNNLHLWNEDQDNWTPVTIPEQQKFLSVSVDYNNQLLAVGTDHKLYLLEQAVITQNLLTVDLKGVSAEAGKGSRVSQLACYFGNVINGGEKSTFQFKSTTQLNIVNHQGAGYAPLHFGVMDNHVMVAGKTNTLKTYFLTKERLPITPGKDTTFTFTFPYQPERGKKDIPSFGKDDQVAAYSAKNQDETFDPKDKQQDTNHHTWGFPFKTNMDTIDKPIHQGVFEFSNIQVADYRGPVIIEVAVKNLPGYWDSVFQLPVVIGNSALTDELSLASTSKTGGNSSSHGSKIYFMSGGANGGVPEISIEENWGLELYGNLPDENSEHGKDGRGIKVRSANLIIPEGKVAIGTEDHTSSDQANTHIFPADSAAHLYVQGDSQLEGKLTVKKTLKVSEKATLDKGLDVTDKTTLNGELEVNQKSTLKKGLAVSDKTTLNGETEVQGEKLVIKSKKIEFDKDTNLNLNGGVHFRHGFQTHHLATFFNKVDFEDEVNLKGTANLHDGANLKGDVTIEGADKSFSVSANTKFHQRVDMEKGAIMESAKVTGWAHIGGDLNVGGKLNCSRFLVGEEGHHGTKISWNFANGHGGTDFWNQYQNGDPNTVAFQFHQPGAPKELLTISRNGRLGIGTIWPKAPIHIAGKTSDFPNIDPGNQHGYFGYAGQEANKGAWTRNDIALWVNGTILISHSNGASDQRIKRNILPSNAAQDINKLLQLEVRNYEYIDTLQHGHRFTKGLIAQEVEEVFPEAVSEHTEFVPDIFSECTSYTVDEEKKQLTCCMDHPHALIAGDRIKLVDHNHKEYQEEIFVVLDPYTFVVLDWTEKVEKIFVYGKEVDDFQAIDYNQVSMMGISAIQALHKEMDDLKTENQTLKQHQEMLTEDLECLKKENATLKDQLLNEMQSLRAEMEALKATPV